MRRLASLIGASAVALAAGVVLLATATAAQAAMSKDEIASAIEAAYGVQVLRVVEVEEEGRPAYAVTMMNPAGDFDDAFQVNTITVDRDTGAPIRAFRHRSSGYDLSGGRGLEDNRQPADVLRGRTWR